MSYAAGDGDNLQHGHGSRLLMSVIAGVVAGSGHLYAGIIIFLSVPVSMQLTVRWREPVDSAQNSGGILTASVTGFLKQYLSQARL